MWIPTPRHELPQAGKGLSQARCVCVNSTCMYACILILKHFVIDSDYSGRHFLISVDLSAELPMAYAARTKSHGSVHISPYIAAIVLKSSASILIREKILAQASQSHPSTDILRSAQTQSARSTRSRTTSGTPAPLPASSEKEAADA
jgi:hypothetical protein